MSATRQEDRDGVEAPPEDHSGVESFSDTLSKHCLELARAETHTLQINVGLICNQACRHCHLEAGPDRRECMSLETMQEVVDYADRVRFQLVDITGGAPEMNPNLPYLIRSIAPLTPRLMLRSNLTAIAHGDYEDLLELCVSNKVVIVASFPSVSQAQTDSQRGDKVSERSIDTLKKLNTLGYGHEGTGLELDLVSNPSGAFLPTAQSEAETRFKRDLKRKWGIVFNQLFTFANMPLGRFRNWLQASGNIDRYMDKLAASFNPCTVEALMCRNLVSVSWDGYLYDCDFNLARGLHLGRRRSHVSEMKGIPDPGTPIATGDHCYGCTAGSGFT
jgi:radical SAM/Cys-rich protein